MVDIYSKDYIIQFLVDKDLHEYKITHSKAVAILAVNIAKEAMTKGNPVCLQAVETGALLHDLGISRTIDDLCPNHASLGGEIAREHGYCDEVARCIEDHEYVIWSKEEGKLFDMEMKRDSFRPETWEEKIVSFADYALFVYSEAAREKEFWEDWYSLAKTSAPYWRDVFKKYKLGGYNKKHPFYERAHLAAKEMRKFVKPEFFEDEEYKELVEKMREEQRASGILVPFPYEEEL